jgi:hypothetical protein
LERHAPLAGEAGRIDVLVNVPLAEARRQFEVNVFGLARPLGAWYHATKLKPSTAKSGACRRDDQLHPRQARLV